MADEIIIVTLLGNQGDPVEFTVVDGVAIPKGTLMQLEDVKIMKKVSGAGVVIAGILGAEKVASNGIVQHMALTNAVILVRCGGSGTATLGSYVRSAGSDNTVTVATTLDHETGKGFARALEDGSNNEWIEAKLAI